MKVLVTGARGRIGRAFLEHAGGCFDLHLTDREGGRLSGREVSTFDVADLEACRRACEGVEVVVHLAADPSPSADFYGSLLESNVKGAYNVFRAATDAGCRRVVYASSVHAVEGYPRDVVVMPDWSVCPVNPYGVTKCFGEALASCFAHSEGLSCLVLRIGTFEANRIMNRPTEEALRSFVSRRDLNQLLVRCVETDVHYGIFHATSDNRRKRLDISSTKEFLGYEPQDDAFELYEPDAQGGC